MNLPEPQSVTFSSLMSDIEKGNIKIPQFQRDFVWDKEKSAKLLDSIVKGYPVGTFIFWKTREVLRTLRDLGGLDLPPTPDGDFTHYVLDGQQRLTTLFAALKGLSIVKDSDKSDYSEFYLDLDSDGDEPVVLPDRLESDHHQTIKLNDLLHGKLETLFSYPEPLQQKIQFYRDRINAYQFSTVLIKEVPIEVATDIFTRLNDSGKPLSVFEIMVAKTFDAERNFDLSERLDELITDLSEVDYGTIPGSVVLQTISILLKKECRKKDILGLPRKDIIDIWPDAIDAIKHAVDYFRNAYRIPVSRLLPYPNLIVPFAYYFFKMKVKPTGEQQKYLADFFWRTALGGRYSQGVESRLSQDIRRIEAVINNELPKYDWAVNTSADFLAQNGKFSVGRAYIKALLCILAFKEPKSFNDNSRVPMSNDWLKQANSKNYHHFFPRAYLTKKRCDEYRINHIANITIVDDYLNKREIGAQPPSRYMRKFEKQNDKLEECMRSHLIRLDDFGVFEDDYDTFFSQRCKALSRELKKRIIEQEIDRVEQAVPAKSTRDQDADED